MCNWTGENIIKALFYCIVLFYLFDFYSLFYNIFYIHWLNENKTTTIKIIISN